MRYALAIIMTSFTLNAELKSSLNSVPGDENTAPLQEEKSRGLPGDRVLPPLNADLLEERLREARKAWEDVQKQDDGKTVEAPATKQEIVEHDLPQTPKDKAPEVSVAQAPAIAEIVPVSVPKPRKTVHYRKPTGEAVTVFHENEKKEEEETITLPSGSQAFGRVKFGEEVTADGKSEVYVELDYAFLGPNGAVVEMTRCFVWVAVTANFHTQKVNGRMRDMTCVAPSGRVFTLFVDGYLVSAASGYAGAESDMIMRGPAKAAALKFLGDITAAYGAATSAAQTTTNIVPQGQYSTDKATNVTGSKEMYVQGKVAEANGDFLKYVSSFFQALQPTLAIAPGTKVHLVNRHNVKVPRIFFKEGKRT